MSRRFWGSSVSGREPRAACCLCAGRPDSAHRLCLHHRPERQCVDRPMRSGGQPDRLREQQAGDAAVGVGRLRRCWYASIQGFATAIAVNAGQTESFKIDTNASAYTIDIYRLGYYQGDGARLIAVDHALRALCPRRSRPASPTRRPTWSTVATGGCRRRGRCRRRGLGRLHRPSAPGDTNDSSHIPFIVRNDASHSDIVFQTSDDDVAGVQHLRRLRTSTLDSPLDRAGRAYKISYNRPFTTRDTSTATTTYSRTSTRPSGTWSATATTSATSAGSTRPRTGACCSTTKSSCRVGHDEYWTGQQRANVEAARDAGVSLDFLSAATRSTGRRAGSRASTARTPLTAPWSATRRPGRTPRSTRSRSGRDVAGPALRRPRRQTRRTR